MPESVLLNEWIKRFNAHDAAAVSALYAPGAAIAINGARVDGRDGVLSHEAALLTAIPNATASVDKVAAENGRTATEITIAGTQTGPFLSRSGESLAPSGNAIRIGVVLVFAANAEGLIETEQRYYDQEELYELTAAQPAECPPPAAIHTLIERYFETANRHDFTALGEMFSETPVVRFLGEPLVTARAGVVASCNMYTVAMPDIRMNLRDVIVQGNQAVVTWTTTGTNTGPLGELPATNRSVAVPGTFVCEIGPDGLIQGLREYYDRGVMLKQLGLI